MGKLQILINDPSTVHHARSSQSLRKKQRLRVKYAYDHRMVCQHAFCYIHDIGEFVLRSLEKHVLESGPCPREHGSKGRKAPNTYPFEVVVNAVEFIKNYARCFWTLSASCTSWACQSGTNIPPYFSKSQNCTWEVSGGMPTRGTTVHAVPYIS